jgi:hypothetical protein
MLPKKYHLRKHDATTRSLIQDGAIALYRAWAMDPEYNDDPKLSNKLIGAGGRDYCHAGLLMRTHEHVLLLDTQQWRDGGVSQFSEEVRQCPGLWDVYHVTHPDYSRRLAVKRMCEIIGRPYGLAALVVAGLRHTAVGRRLWPRINVDEYFKNYNPHCSMAVSDAVRKGRVDLCPDRADLFTEPVHIAQSEFTEYFGTLIF